MARALVDAEYRLAARLIGQLTVAALPGVSSVLIVAESVRPGTLRNRAVPGKIKAVV